MSEIVAFANNFAHVELKSTTKLMSEKDSKKREYLSRQFPGGEAVMSEDVNQLAKGEIGDTVLPNIFFIQTQVWYAHRDRN